MKETFQNIKSLKDYSAEEIKTFDHMHKVLAEYNASLGTKSELPLPNYTDREMAAYSGYRELVLAEECKDW